MAISLTQNVGANSSGAIITMPFASGNAAGSLLTLSLGVPSTSTPASTVTDSAGNLWVLGARANQGSGGAPTNQVWYVVNAAGSTNTVLVASGISASPIQCSLQEWAGISTASPVINVSTRVSTAAASTHSAGSPQSPTASSVLFLAHFVFASVFDISTDPSGFTPTNSTFPNIQTFHKILSGSTSTEDAACASSATEVSAAVMISFSGMDGAAATTRPHRSRLTLLGVS